MLKMVTGLNSGWGKIWSWQAFLIVCCHTVLSLLMAEVRWVWYCVTMVVGGGMAVMIACWNVWMLSDSLCSPQAHWVSCRFVTSMPRVLWADQSSGSVCMCALMVRSSVVSASMSWAIRCGCCGGVDCVVDGVCGLVISCMCAAASCGRLLWVCWGVCLWEGSLVGVQ